MLNTTLITEDEITEVASIHSEQFPRQTKSEQWITCYYNAFPKSMCFAAKLDGNIVGYIVWTQKSGFRPEAVLELEQIAIAEAHQNKGVGSELITQSLDSVKNELKKNGSVLKSVLVSTRTDNFAQELYKKTLNARPEAVISNLFSGDEVYMVGRLENH